jgi:hypothetical protein
MFSSMIFFVAMSLAPSNWECKAGGGASLEAHEVKEEKMNWIQTLFFSSLEFLGMVKKKESFKLSDEKPGYMKFDLIIKKGELVYYITQEEGGIELTQKLLKVDETTFLEITRMGTNFFRIVPHENSRGASLFVFGSNTLRLMPRALLLAYQCERFLWDEDFEDFE